MNNRGFTLIELMIVVVIIGILAATAIPGYSSMKNRAKEASLKSNCHTVQLAAEEFSVLSEGMYPTDVDADLTPDGRTIIDLLPGSQRIDNTFTHVATEPVNGAAPANPGEISYSPVIDLGFVTGYTIHGADSEVNIIVSMTSGR